MRATQIISNLISSLPHALHHYISLAVRNWRWSGRIDSPKEEHCEAKLAPAGFCPVMPSRTIAFCRQSNSIDTSNTSVAVCTAKTVLLLSLRYEGIFMLLILPVCWHYVSIAQETVWLMRSMWGWVKRCIQHVSAAHKWRGRLKRLPHRPEYAISHF